MNLLIDNYDSFTYNIVQYLGDIGEDFKVMRNDEVSASAALAQKPNRVLISPGPGTPQDSGICIDMIDGCAKNKIPLYGICLGMQALGAFFGGHVIRAPAPIHGKTERIKIHTHAMFHGLPETIEVVRYHSLIVDRATLPDALEVTAETEDGLIMGLAHKTLPLWGVQFHPESIASEYGHEMLRNFINLETKS